MARGFSGLLILILVSLLIISVLFAATKFIVPNPQTVEEGNRVEQDAQDATQNLINKSIENQSVEIE